MEKKSTNPLSELRPGFINLKDIYGVDIEKGTFEEHPDFPQIKLKTRKSVLQSLSSATSPLDIPPIEVYLTKDGSVAVVEGYHRLENAIAKCEGSTESPWAKIRAIRAPNVSTVEAQIRAGTHNINEMKGNLTDIEFVHFVERLVGFGLSREEIVTKLGHTSKRLVAKIFNVLDATPDVLAAVKEGKVSLESGDKIATKVPVKEQAEKVKEVEKVEKKDGGTKARTDTGLRKQRTKVLPLKGIFKEIFGLWEPWLIGKEDNSKLDEYVDGQMDFALKVLMMDDFKLDEIKSVLQPMYEEYTEAENATPKTRGRPKKAA